MFTLLSSEGFLLVYLLQLSAYALSHVIQTFHPCVWGSIF